MYRNSRDVTDKIYPVSIFDKISNPEAYLVDSNSAYSEYKCDLETFKSFIRRDIETLLNSRSHTYWRDLHPKEKPIKSLVRGDDPNSANDETDIYDGIVSAPEDNEPKRPRCTHFEYGLSDYSLCNLSDHNELQELMDEIKFKIEAFEPRLKGISVKQEMKQKNSNDRSIKIIINASLNVDEYLDAEDSRFDTCLKPVHNKFFVE